VESVAAFAWNGWQASSGISGNLGLEYALFPTSLLQKRGQCIQSKKYPAIGIVVDYEGSRDSIVRVRHGMSAKGCTQ